MKMKLISLFKTKEARLTWGRWPSCKHPKTLSFRVVSDDMFKTVNSVFLDISEDGITTPETCFTNSNSVESTSLSPEHSEEDSDDEDASLGKVISQVVNSDRLFIDLGQTNSILGVQKDDNNDVPFKDSVAMAVESAHPYMDFKRSMEEMVQCHGFKNWEDLEELLGWYLKVNGKKNHGFIIAAFVDLLGSVASKSKPSDSTSCYSSAVSSLSPLSSPVCSSQGENELHIPATL